MAKPTTKLKNLKKRFARKINATHREPRKNRYPDELKQSVVELAKTTDLSLYRIAKELNINYSLIHTWVKAA